MGEIIIREVERIEAENERLAPMYRCGEVGPLRQKDFIREILEIKGIQGVPVGLFYYGDTRTAKIMYQ